MKCAIRLKSGEILEANNRVALRRKLRQFADGALTKWGLTPYEVQKMKSMVAQSAIEAFELEVKRRRITSNVSKMKLFSDMFTSADINKNALTAPPTKEKPNTVVTILGKKFAQSNRNPETSAALKNLIKVLRLSERFESIDGKEVNDVFQNPLIREVLSEFRQRGFYVTVERNAFQKDESVQPLENWQREVHTISQYNSLSEELKYKLNNIRRKKFNSKGELVDAYGFLNLPETHSFAYAYKRLIHLLGNSGTSKIMEEKIDALRATNPLISQLFPEDMSSNEDQKIKALIWAKIASNYKYSYYDTVISNEEGKIVQTVQLANFESNAKVIYSQLLRNGRESGLVKGGTYDKTQINVLINALDKATTNYESAQALSKFGLFNEEDGIDVNTDEFTEAVTEIYNELKAPNGDLLSITPNSESSALLSYSQAVSDSYTSIMNNMHFNHKGEKVYEFNNSNFTSRTISRIQNGEDIYIDDPLYKDNRVIEAIKEGKAEYIVINAMKLDGKKSKIGYPNMNKQQLGANQLILFAKKNAIELPIHADSSSMTAIAYPTLIKKGVLNDDKSFTPNEKLIDDLVTLARNELDTIRDVHSTDKSTKFLQIFPELQDLIGTTVNDEVLRERVLDALDKRVKSYKKYLLDAGLYEVKTSKRGISRVLAKEKSLRGIHEDVINDFVYNYSLLYPSAALTFNAHPNFYDKSKPGDTVEIGRLKTLASYDKRTKQIWSPTTPLFVGAQYTSNGDTTTVSEKYSIQILKDVEGVSKSFQKTIARLQIKYSKENRGDGRYDGIVEAFNASSETDGQSYIDPFRYKQILVGLGEWNNRKDMIYQKMIKGEFNFIEKIANGKFDNEFFFSALKSFHYSLEEVDGVVQPMQKKDSEIIIHPMHGVRTLKNGKPNSYYNPFYRYMLENMGYEFTDTEVTTPKGFEVLRSENVDKTFIDVYSFDSAIKTGNPNGLDLDKGAVYDISNEFDKDAVSPLDIVNQIKELSKTVLDPGNNDYYLIKGKKYKRVTSTYNSKKPDRTKHNLVSSSNLGTKLDDLTRDFLEGKVKPYAEYNLASMAEMIKYTEFLKGLKKKLAANGETIVANGILLHNEEMGVAGTVDLMTYTSDGKFNIYDLKSMKVNSPGEIKDGEFLAVHQGGQNKGQSKYDYAYEAGDMSNREKHTNQLNMYAILLKNTYGIDVDKLAVIPVGLTYNSKDVAEGVNNKKEVKEGVKTIYPLKGIKINKRKSVKGIDTTYKPNDNKVTLKLSNPKASAIQLSNYDYGKQQDVPPHFLDTGKALAKQTGKNVKANVNDNGKYTIAGHNHRKADGTLERVADRVVTGKELKELANQLEIEEILDHYEEVTGEMVDFKAMISTIKKEVLRRGMSNNYIEALDLVYGEDGYSTVAPLDFPAYAYKVKQIINSIYTKKVTNPKKFQGVSYVNASSFGFDEATRPKIVFEGDRIKHVEALVPIHDSRLYKYLEPGVPFDKAKIKEIVDAHPEMEDVFKGIVWRVPNESKYSTIPIVITGFIPTEIGSAIYLPVEITDIAGLDFDIDKMYGFYYAFESENIDKIYDQVIDEVSEKEIWKIIKKDPIYALYMSEAQTRKDGTAIKKAKTIKEFVEWIYQDGDYKQHAEIRKAFDKFTYEAVLTVPRDDSRKGRQNRLLDIYKTMLGSLDATYETLSPASNFNKILDKLKEELGISEDLPLMGQPQRAIETRSNALDGKALVGPFANANSILSVFQQAETLYFKPSIIKDKKTKKTKVIQQGFKLNGKLFNNLNNRNITSDVDNFGYRFRSQNIALWLAAIVDNAKNPYAGDLNVNWSNINVVVAMLTAGVDFKTTMYFVNQPILRYYSERFKYHGGDNSAERKAMQDAIVMITGKYENGKLVEEGELTEAQEKQIKGKYSYDFKADQLKKAGTKGLNDPLKYAQANQKESLDVLTSFSKYISYGEALRKATLALKTAEDGVGSSDGQTLATSLKILEALEDDTIVGMADLIMDDSKTHYHLTRLLVDLNDKYDDNPLSKLLNDAYNNRKVEEREIEAKEALSDIKSTKKKKVVKAVTRSKAMLATIEKAKSMKDVMTLAMQHLNIPAYNRGLYFGVIKTFSSHKKKIMDNQLTGKEIENLLHDFKQYILTSEIEGGVSFLNTFANDFVKRVSKHPEFGELLDNFIVQADVKETSNFLFYHDTNNEIAEEKHYKENLMHALYTKDPGLVMDLAKYAVYMDGLGASAFGFTNLIPQEAFEALGLFSDKANSIKMSLAQESKDTASPETIKFINKFVVQFIQNNASKLSFVKDYTPKNMEAGLPYLYHRGSSTVYILNNETGSYIPFPELGFRFEQTETDIVAGKHFKVYDSILASNKPQPVKTEVEQTKSTTETDTKEVDNSWPDECPF